MRVVLRIDKGAGTETGALRLVSNVWLSTIGKLLTDPDTLFWKLLDEVSDESV